MPEPVLPTHPILCPLSIEKFIDFSASSKFYLYFMETSLNSMDPSIGYVIYSSVCNFCGFSDLISINSKILL